MNSEQTPSKLKYLPNASLINTLEKQPLAHVPIPVTAVTAKVIRKVQLFDDQYQKHLFPILRDRQLGISSQYQDCVIQTWNDDDRKTTSTQLEKGVGQTLHDLYSVVKNPIKPSTQP